MKEEITTRIDKSLHKRLKILAAEKEVSIKKLIERSVDTFLFFSPEGFKSYNDILDLTEDITERYWEVKNRDEELDRGILNMTKVVNDCRAILLLCQTSFYMQAGIIANSAYEANNEMMKSALNLDDGKLIEDWLNNNEEKNKYLNRKMFEDAGEVYNEADKVQMKNGIRIVLKNFIEGTYLNFRLYPRQAFGPKHIDEQVFRKITSWKSVLCHYLVGCLLFSRFIITERAVPELKIKASEALKNLVNSMIRYNADE